ncbi:hypothetical protein BpHYR1_029524 [Brachionus plicatilis]|uniref:Uncharacterized protein n=1 Tax=Brachionus plicatilis TaxID=10195 RepID=A0A3M7R776_BRAPC|nr:hypothetical protein BpHYR1_029524 [Brachionus plicatilis]
MILWRYRSESQKNLSENALTNNRNAQIQHRYINKILRSFKKVIFINLKSKLHSDIRQIDAFRNKIFEL